MIAAVLPRQMPRVKWKPMIVPANPWSLVVSSLPNFIPIVDKYPQVMENKPKFASTITSELKKLDPTFSKVSK